MSDDGGHRSDDDTNPMLAYRMTALERRVDAGFRHIDERLDSLGFVRADVYAADQRDTDRRLSAVEKKLTPPDGEVPQAITAAASPGRWALNLMITAFVVAMVGGLVTLALQGGG